MWIQSKLNRVAHLPCFYVTSSLASFVVKMPLTSSVVINLQDQWKMNTYLHIRKSVEETM